MSDALVEFERAEEALSNPALQLVTHKWAALVLAVLRSTFGSEQRAVPVDRVYLRVEAHLEELRELGHEVPEQDPRSLCREWLNRQWLRRLVDADDVLSFELTSHVFVAMRMIDNLSRQSAMLSESRLTMILDAVHRAAVDADPDRESRVLALDEQIERLTRERDALRDGADVPVASDERMLMHYRDIVDLLGQLPGDFRRVEESIAAMRQRMVQSFREDRRPRGEVLGEYLQASAHLMLQTEEGRAFTTALEMLRDESLLDTFRADTRKILAHPFAETDAMSAKDRRLLLSADAVLRSGLQTVQAQQHRATRSLTEYLETHDAAGERELSQTLAELDRALGMWMQHARPRDTAPMPWMPALLELAHLPSQTYAPELDRTPAPAARLDEMAVPDPTSLDDLRRSGGPRTEALVGQIRQLLDIGAAETVAEAFGLLPAEDRRPVELWGLAQWAVDEQLWDPLTGMQPEVLRTVRPDGTRRTLTFPHLSPREEHGDD